MSDAKHCPHCGEPRPVMEGMAWCAACHAAWMRAYRAAHPEYVERERANARERIRRWRANRANVGAA